MARIVSAVATMFLALFAAGCESRRNAVEPAPATSAPVPQEAKPFVALPGGQRIEVEVAPDDDLRAQGLMYRESLPRGRGMLFLFPENGNYPFWMKNTRIPLDMIWIDQSYQVARIHRNVPPCIKDPCPSYDPQRESRFVLELAGGEAAFFGLKEGDEVVFSGLERFKAR